MSTDCADFGRISEPGIEGIKFVIGKHDLVAIQGCIKDEGRWQGGNIGFLDWNQKMQRKREKKLKINMNKRKGYSRQWWARLIYKESTEKRISAKADWAEENKREVDIRKKMQIVNRKRPRKGKSGWKILKKLSHRKVCFPWTQMLIFFALNHIFIFLVWFSFLFLGNQLILLFKLVASLTALQTSFAEQFSPTEHNSNSWSY